MKHKSKRIASAAMIFVATGTAVEAQAQQLEEIVVTARKREENLQTVPVAVTAFTAQRIESMGLNNLQDISKFSPGVDVQNQGAGAGGRYIAGIRFRGMNPTALTPSFQVGALFVDGIYFLGGAQSVGLDDVERVEVIRGPQAAYFGRSTFGGAINYITRDPASVLGGKVSAEYGSRHSYELSGAIEGPLVSDRLDGRLSASVHQKGRQYTATDGGALGKERTISTAGTLLFKPSDNLKIKVRASFSQDNDGAPTITNYSFTARGNCPVGTPVSFKDTSGATRTGALNTPLQCGAIPFGEPITSNTGFPSSPYPAALLTGAPAGRPPIVAPLDVRSVLVDNSFNSPLLAAAPKLDHIGLIRNTQRYTAMFDYNVSDTLIFSGNAAFNRQDTNSLRDGDFSDTYGVYVATPYAFRDYSGEARLRYEGTGKLRALIGVNYYKQKVDAGFANAVEVTYGFGGTLAAPGSRPYPLANGGGSFDRIRTFGVFGSLDYQLLRWLTATLEGRYQDDRVSRFGGTFANGIVQLADSLRGKNFLPRAILTARPSETVTVYGSFARGVLPGDINTALDILTPSDKAEAIALLGPIQRTVPPEKIDSYELGLKQTLLDGALRYAITGYLLNWTNQKSTASVFLSINRGTSFRVTGDSRISGIEFESSWAATQHLELGGTFSYTHARYRDFKLPGNGPLFGVNTIVGYNAAGNTLPRFPIWNGSLSGTWTDRLTGDWDWFLRGDAVFVGKSYIDETNLNWVKPYQIFNLRAGVSTEAKAVSIEFYANNLFGKEAWATGSPSADTSIEPIQTPNAPGVTPPAVLIVKSATLTPIDRREFGIRAIYKF